MLSQCLCRSVNKDKKKEISLFSTNTRAYEKTYLFMNYRIIFNGKLQILISLKNWGFLVGLIVEPDRFLEVAAGLDALQ